MPGRIACVDGVKGLKYSLCTTHQLTKMVICRITVCHVRGPHGVIEYNIAHPYHTVKSPGFDEESENRSDLRSILSTVQVRSDQPAVLPVTRLVRTMILGFNYTLTTPSPP